MQGQGAGVPAGLRGGNRLVFVLAALIAMLATLAFASVAQAAYQWQSGPLVESQDFNCITGSVEQEAGSYMSYYFDPTSPPLSGQTYYVAINTTGIGNTCAGIYADVELYLPAGTSLAIDSTHPVECFLQFPSSSSYTRDTQDCPGQSGSLSLGAYGDYSLDPLGNPGFWPLPQGGTVEVNVPVKTTVTGATQSANQIVGNVHLADGDLEPQLTPYINSIVNAATQAPSSGNGNHNYEVSVSYASPSVTTQAQAADHSVSVDATGYVWNNSALGTATAQITLPSAPHTAQTTSCSSPYNVGGTVSAATYSYPYSVLPVAVLQSPDTVILGNPYTFTGLYPATSYCWRLVATVTSPAAAAGTYYGNWQFFNTIGSPLAGPPPPPFSTAAPATGTSDCSTSGSGCVTSACSATGTCAGCTSPCLTMFSPPKPAPNPTPPAPSPVAPTVSGAAQTHPKWKAGSALAVISKAKHHHQKAHGPPIGTTFTFALNESASVTLTFTENVKGRMTHGKCVAQTKGNKKKPSCALTTAAGTLSFTGHSGTNTVVFDGRVSAAQKLSPGSYTVAIGATSSALTATASSLEFTVAK